MPGYGEGNFSLFSVQKAMNQGMVFLFHRAPFELARERGMGLVVLRGNHEPGGVLVEPVDNPRPQGSPNSREVFTVFEKSVDQGPG